jgi:hypothetical protein
MLVTLGGVALCMALWALLIRPHLPEMRAEHARALAEEEAAGSAPGIDLSGVAPSLQVRGAWCAGGRAGGRAGTLAHKAHKAHKQPTGRQAGRQTYRLTDRQVASATASLDP